MSTLTSRRVRAEFKKRWAERCQDVPAYKTDLPAKRMAFTCFVDDLERDGKITDRVAQNATLEEDE